MRYIFWRQRERDVEYVCMAPALSLALKDPNVEFIPSLLLSLGSFSSVHIINELIEQCV